MPMDLRQFRVRMRKSSSNPMVNMKYNRPIFANSWKAPKEAVGKTVVKKPGIWPNADGPSRMPAMISPTTAGCRARIG
jgi:hypothetical protein